MPTAPRPLGGSGSRGSKDQEEPPEWHEILEDGPASAGEQRWYRLVRVLRRLRRLQRYFGYIGQFLQQFGPDVRRRLRDVLPKDRQ